MGDFPDRLRSQRLVEFLDHATRGISKERELALYRKLGDELDLRIASLRDEVDDHG